MRWEDLEQSQNVEDRRDETYAGGGGGGFGLPIGGGGFGIGTMLVIALIAWGVFGINPLLLLGLLSGSGGGFGNQQSYQPSQSQMQSRRTGAPSDDIGNFVSRVLGSTEVQWKDIFSKGGATYRAPILVMYRGQTQAPCGGVAQSAMGPFYCPNDQKVYLDTSFFREIEQRFQGCEGKSCQFSQAYVIAHEVGHHVQNLLGILPKVQSQQQAVSKAEGNRLQVRVELQADCLAGVWANHENQRQIDRGRPPFIESGDVEAALQTAAAIGDDTLQRKATGHVVPDSFTHGSSEQRQRWFQTGLKQGSVAACDTFKAAQL
jgi:predicted metalloprotease